MVNVSCHQFDGIESCSMRTKSKRNIRNNFRKWESQLRSTIVQNKHFNRHLIKVEKLNSNDIIYNYKLSCFVLISGSVSMWLTFLFAPNELFNHYYGCNYFYMYDMYNVQRAAYSDIHVMHVNGRWWAWSFLQF